LPVQRFSRVVELDRPAAGSANQIPNPIDDRTPQICVQRTNRMMPKVLQALERPQEGVLHDIFGIGVAAHLWRNAPARPPPHPRQRPFHEIPRRVSVAILRTFEDVEGRIRGQWSLFGAPVIGRHLSHFYVIRSIGVGGMGVVYEAQDTRLPRSVAIKVLKDELSRDAEAIRRFKREARLASSLNHPNICTILDVSETGAHAFIAMELLEGESLKARLQRAPPTLAEIADIIRQVVSALGAAHDHGIIHRDITPANIFLTDTGLVKLLDFGLATNLPTATDDDTTDDVLRREPVAGTVHYMAPEQFAEDPVVDRRTDFYALGAVVYEMATGRRPFACTSRRALIDAITQQPHTPVRDIAPHLPAHLGRIIDRLLAKHPDQRYQSAASLLADLDLTHSSTTDLRTPEPAGGYSAVPEAYHAFKNGKRLWASCHEGGWRPALDEFRRAVDLDPQFGRAYAALAEAHNFLGFYSIVSPGGAFAEAAQAADRAVKINPRLGRAFIELGLAKLGGEWDWEGAEAAFRRGLALDANDAMAHIHYSWLLMLLERRDAAFAEADLGLALAPSSRLVAAGRAQTMYLAGDYDRAIHACSDCLRFDDKYVFAIHLRGLCHLANKSGTAAMTDLELAARLSGRAPFYLGLLGRCYAEHGMRQQAVDILDELKQLPVSVYVPPQCYVFVYAGLGERERALESQEQAYADGASPFNYRFPGIRELYARSPDHRRRLEQMRLVL
jgi:tetratricopeptide (TPR) repeat protein/tRNA A-37 threonylcarbamoyl transferase component Bud32